MMVAQLAPNGKAAKIGSVDPKGETFSEHEMMKVRKEFAPVFKGVIFSVLLMIILSVVSTLLVIFSKNDAAVAALFVRLIQITFGMILGASCVFFGVIVSWLGITAVHDINAGIENSGLKSHANLQSVGP